MLPCILEGMPFLSGNLILLKASVNRVESSTGNERACFACPPCAAD